MATPNKMDSHPDWLTAPIEWKECRNTIARLDSIIADFRKYSFSLVTILITASSFVGQPTASPAARVAVPVAIMILIFALFAVDRYYMLLLTAAVERGLDLEGPSLDRKLLKNDTLTQVITIYAIDSLSVFIAPVLYIGLLLATLILSSAVSDQGTSSEAFTTFKLCLGLLVAYFVYTEWRRPTGFFRRKRFKDG